jgi:hypothetical protein
MPTKEELRVIVVPEGDGYLAQCVDLDIGAEAQTAEQAIDEFVNTFLRYILVAKELNQVPFENVPKPPAEYKEKWKSMLSKGTEPMRFKIPKYRIQSRADSDDSELEREGLALLV